MPCAAWRRPSWLRSIRNSPPRCSASRKAQPVSSDGAPRPAGTKFDGALGGLAALEAVRSLSAAGYETFAPIEVINWTNEEGARFAPAMLASGVFAGVFARDWAWSRHDRAGVTFGDALGTI